MQFLLLVFFVITLTLYFLHITLHSFSLSEPNQLNIFVS